MADPAPPARRALSVAVGVFALWQLVYLPAANVIDFVPRRPGPTDLHPEMRLFQTRGTFTANERLQTAAEKVGNVLDFWGELTGQEQGWSLFAPGFPPHTIFPAVEFRFPDGTAETLRSPFEPADLTDLPARAPLVHNRMYSVEVQFSVAGWFCTNESLADRPEVWQKVWPEFARDGHRHTLAWLKWRLKAFQKSHPDRGEPGEVILKFRYIPTPLPSEPRGWAKPAFERPFARWNPAAPPQPGVLPLEGYDPVAKQFVPLKAEGTP
jgi:hypothetical protein